MGTITRQKVKSKRIRQNDKKERELKKKSEKRNKTDKIDIKEQSLMLEKI